MHEDQDYEALAETWKRPAGVFVLVDARGAAGQRIHAIQQKFDPKLAATNVPHLTLVGSSGVGPIAAGTTVDEMRARVEPIAMSFTPLSLQFGAPVKFMQREIVVLPLAPNGPLRELHERIARSGLSFERAKFTFTPHVTLNFFRTLPREELKQLLAERVDEPLIVDHLRFSLTDDPLPTRDLFELPLTGA
jgi:2'-5' RNA ligase